MKVLLDNSRLWLCHLLLTRFCSHNVTDKKPSEKALVKKKWKLGKAHLFFGSMLESKRTC